MGHSAKKKRAKPLAPGSEKTLSPAQQVPAEAAALLLRRAHLPRAAPSLLPSLLPARRHSPAGSGSAAGPAAGVVGGEDHAGGAGPPAHGAARRIPSGDAEAKRGGPATARPPAGGAPGGAGPG